MIGLTKRQNEILQFIQAFIEKNHFSPSYREIMEHFGFSSLGSVHKHLSVLKRKGMITSEKQASRSVMPLQRIGGEESRLDIDLPFIGYVTKGVPIETFPRTQTLAVPGYFVRSEDRTYVLRAYGDGFRDELIADGDLLIIEARQEPNDGETILGFVGEQETFLLRYHPEGNTVRLESQNSFLAPQVFHSEEIQIMGVLSGLLRLG